MSAMRTTELERENLEAHVDLCAERYGQLETRLSIIEIKVNQLAESINESQRSMVKVIVGSTATIVGAVLSAVVTILLKF